MTAGTRYGMRAAAGGATLFVGMLVFMELGRQIGLRELAESGAASRSAIGVIDGAIFGLLSLLLGFTFNGAAARFDSRRHLVVGQVSAISTAWQRIDLLPERLQTTIRAAFREYVDALIQSVEHIASGQDPSLDREGLVNMETALWTETVSVWFDTDGQRAGALLVPSVNEMMGAAKKERLARRIHPPMAIYVVLTLATLAAALFAGYSMANVASRNWLHMIGVSAAISITMYVVVNLEYPRRGFIGMRDMDRALVDLRATMR